MAVVSAAALALGVAACSSAPSDSTSAGPSASPLSAVPPGEGLPVTPSENALGPAAADVWAFASQGDALAFLVKDRATSPEVKELGKRMGEGYQAVMSDVADIYSAEGLTPPSGFDFANDIRDGMVPLDRMTQLANTFGPEFDRLWLESMIAHHEGFIQVVVPALGSSDPEVQKLTKRLIEEQTAELDDMRALLATLP